MTDKHDPKKRLPVQGEEEDASKSKMTEQERINRNAGGTLVDVEDEHGNDIRPEWLRSSPELAGKPSKDFGERLNEPLRIVHPDEK